MKVGDKVLVFDSSKFVDDIKTPLPVTMREATVLRMYHKRGFGGIGIDHLADVQFSDRRSNGHFVSGIRHAG